MKTVQVKFDHLDGNHLQYYRTIPNKQLICIVDGTWHTATDDNCWEEPIGPIDDSEYYIEIVA